MAKVEFGKIASPGWSEGDSDPRDKGVLRLRGADVKDINIQLGFGQASSSCSVTLVEEEEGTFKEPNIGSVLRLAIPNLEAGNPELYDVFDSFYTMSFVGIVRTINNVENTNGQEKIVELFGTKEILKNIPVILNKIGSTAKTDFELINNITYAFKEGERNSKGLTMSAIQEAVEDKEYLYYPNNATSYGGVSYQKYEIDMSEMFKERARTTYSEDIFYGSIDGTTDGRFKNNFDDGKLVLEGMREGFDDLIGDGYGDDDFDNSIYQTHFLNPTDRYADEEKYIVSPNYRIEGDSKNLIDIIDNAMTRNGCDWYVRAYEKSNQYSLVNSAIYGTTVIKIIPIVRNEFDQFTEFEFNSFVGGLNGVESSKTLGKEFANEVSNKAFFGAKWEALQRVPVEANSDDEEDMRHFWGFKKEGEVETKEIVDRYGNTIKVAAEINENPTFDTSSMQKVDLIDSVYSSAQLRLWLISVFGYGEDDLKNEDGDELTRKELISLMEEDTEFEESYEFDINDKNETDDLFAQNYTEYMFYLLSNMYKTQLGFESLLLAVYNYVEYYDKVIDSFSKMERYSGITNYKQDNIFPTGFSGITFGDVSVTGDHIILPPDFSVVDIRVGYTHAMNWWDESNLPRCIRGSSPVGESITDEVIVEHAKKRPIFVIYINGEEWCTDSGVGMALIEDVIEDTSWNYLHNFKITESTILRNTLAYGINTVEIKAIMTPRKLGAGQYTVYDYYKFYVEWYGEEGNVYDLIRETPLYKWAKALGIAFLKSDEVENNIRSATAIAVKSTSPVGTSGSSSKQRVLWNKYQGFINSVFEERSEKLHSIVSSYLDEHVDRTYYKKLTTNNWLTSLEAWDGSEGYAVTDPVIRGKFVNKQTGKMPCLYRITDAEYVEVNQKSKDVLFIKRQNENNNYILNIYGKATCEIYAIGGTAGSAQDNRYLICTMDNSPKRKDKKNYSASLDVNSADTVIRADSIDAEKRSYSERSYEEFMEEVFNSSNIGYFKSANNARVDGMAYQRPTLRIAPIAFYVPTIHSFVRYGPWMLDGRSVNLNRSNYGITKINTSNDLNPWAFKSYGDVQNYILDQNKNTLMTEYRLNRGQVVAADIPRFNIGRKIGNFSNISGISVSYGADGVSTTYTLTAFGAGNQIKGQRDQQKVSERIGNIEDDIAKIDQLITREELMELLNGRSELF